MVQTTTADPAGVLTGSHFLVDTLYVDTRFQAHVQVFFYHFSSPGVFTSY